MATDDDALLLCENVLAPRQHFDFAHPRPLMCHLVPKLWHSNPHDGLQILKIVPSVVINFSEFFHTNDLLAAHYC